MKCKQKHFPVMIEQDEDGVFIMSCPLFAGCHSYGQTIEEGLANISEAIEVCLEDRGDESCAQFIGVRDIQLAI
jgi:predicted RNase H-like HicB family nuclease